MGAARMVLRGLALRCPRCGRPGIARSFFALRAACPACGAPIETGTGESSGGMAINLVTTTVIATVVIWWGGVLGTMPLLPLTVGLIAGAIAFTLAFHRHACGAWVGALHATRDIGEAPVRVQAGSGRRAGAGVATSGRASPARRMASDMPVATRQSAPDNQKAV